MLYSSVLKLCLLLSSSSSTPQFVRSIVTVETLDLYLSNFLTFMAALDVEVKFPSL